MQSWSAYSKLLNISVHSVACWKNIFVVKMAV